MKFAHPWRRHWSLKRTVICSCHVWPDGGKNKESRLQEGTLRRVNDSTLITQYGNFDIAPIW